MIWSFDEIKEMISEAETNGESHFRELASPREAELFQKAISNRRRNHNIGPNLTTKIEGNKIKIIKRPEIKRETNS